MSTLATLITDAADDPSKLNAIIAEIEGGSLDSDNPMLYPAPTFDAATNTWRLTQSTPNANGLYEGAVRSPTPALRSPESLDSVFFFAVCWVQ